MTVTPPPQLRRLPHLTPAPPEAWASAFSSCDWQGNTHAHTLTHTLRLVCELRQNNENRVTVLGEKRCFNPFSASFTPHSRGGEWRFNNIFSSGFHLSKSYVDKTIFFKHIFIAPRPCGAVFCVDHYEVGEWSGLGGSSSAPQPFSPHPCAVWETIASGHPGAAIEFRQSRAPTAQVLSLFSTNWYIYTLVVKESLWLISTSVLL